MYVENATKSDDRGYYEGWSNRFDEWIPLYSPRLQPYQTKTTKGIFDEIDLDEDMDEMMKPPEGRDRVYAVPRERKCISSLFMHLINLFGHLKGYDLLLECMTKGDNETLDLNVLSSMMTIASAPYLIYHKDFAHEYGPKFVAVCKERIKSAPEKSLRDVRREKIEGIIRAIDNLQRRYLTKEEREKSTEVLKLEVSIICLRSSYLERRIQGIRDLNSLIRSHRQFSKQSFTSAFLIDWMKNNGVFSILFDPKQTHLQLV